MTQSEVSVKKAGGNNKKELSDEELKFVTALASRPAVSKALVTVRDQGDGSEASLFEWSQDMVARCAQAFPGDHPFRKQVLAHRARFGKEFLKRVLQTVAEEEAAEASAAAAIQAQQAFGADDNIEVNEGLDYSFKSMSDFSQGLEECSRKMCANPVRAVYILKHFLDRAEDLLATSATKSFCEDVQKKFATFMRVVHVSIPQGVSAAMDKLLSRVILLALMYAPFAPSSTGSADQKSGVQQAVATFSSSSVSINAAMQWLWKFDDDCAEKSVDFWAKVSMMLFETNTLQHGNDTEHLFALLLAWRVLTLNKSKLPKEIVSINAALTKFSQRVTTCADATTMQNVYNTLLEINQDGGDSKPSKKSVEELTNAILSHFLNAAANIPSVKLLEKACGIAQIANDDCAEVGGGDDDVEFFIDDVGLGDDSLSSNLIPDARADENEDIEEQKRPVDDSADVSAPKKKKRKNVSK